ncbi:MAG TPA: TonB-dependent receptor [Mucilaginibacter sp.]|jgi:TonB-linked SusC/RagA family outer membrane protein
MKKTYRYFIIRRYEKRISLCVKCFYALLIVALIQLPALGSVIKNNHKELSRSFLSFKQPRTKSEFSDVTVNGKVTDEKGEVLIGATIAVKNGKAISITDVTGAFSLRAPENATLVVSYVGYKTEEIAINGRTQIDVSLTPLAGNLNEVVVVGYTTQRKKDLTGAVSVISSKDINAIPVGGVDQIMQGKAAGVTVTENTGAPGDGISVLVRGVGTINSNAPLYIVDGVPTQNGINQISPGDIESINILKDASSAAIYGARAASGVVIVTTKRGKSGKTRLSFDAYTGIQTAQNLIKMADNAQYVKAFNTAAKNDGRSLISDSLASTLSDVNWLKEVLKPAPISNINLSISGGNETSQYIVAGNYFTQDGLIKNSSFDRFNLRTAVSGTVSKYLKLGTNVNLSYSKTRVVGTSGDGYTGAAASIVRYALFRTPGTPVYNSAGQFVDLPKQDPSVNGNFLGDGINPVALADASNNNYYGYTILGDAYAELDPIKGLKIKSDIGLNLIQTDYKQFFETFGIDRHFNSPNSLAQSHTNNLNYNWTNTATYDLTLGKNVLNFLIGTEAIKQDVQALSASRTGFVNQTSDFQYLDNGTASSQQNGGNEFHLALFSLFGRVNYQYNNKYLASFNFRRDGSSQLDPSSQYENFYSGSLGWRIDQEDFMKNIKPISTFKLRVSVGQLGNSQIGTYPATSLISANSSYPFGGTTNQGYTITSKGNPNIHWETSTQEDVGLDMGFFENALMVTADYYIKNTSNMLLYQPEPSSAGDEPPFPVGTPAVNAGKVRNSGFELEITYKKTINTNWNYSLGGNFATIANKVISLADGTPLPGGRVDNNYNATLTAVGHPIGEFYLLQQEGIFQNAQQVFTHAYQGPGIRPGDVMYKDVNGDGVIDDKDRSFVGSPIPKFTYGFTGTVSYKNFDLSVFFQGVYGNKIYNQVLTDIEGFYRPFNVTQRIVNNAWTGPGSTNTYPLLSWSDGNNNKMPSTRFLEDGAYLRLKNVQLGYKFGPNTLKSLSMSSVRVFVSGQNLLTFTKYSGLDPEQYQNSNNAADGVRAVGIDWGTYPSARTITVGVNANF